MEQLNPPTPERIDVFASVVAVVDESTHDVVSRVAELQHLLDANYANYEIVIADNGIAPETLVQLRSLLDTLPCIRILRLSRQFSYDTAVFSVLESAIGDFVVVTDLARDPLELVPELIARLRQGADIVQGLSIGRVGGSMFQRMGRSFFYWYNRRALGVVIPKRATYFSAFSRRAVNSLLSADRRFRYLRHLMRHIGYEIVEVEYQPHTEVDVPRPLKRGLSDAVEMITSYSLRPLRVVAIGGLGVALLNLLYAVYVVVTFFAQDAVEQGWTTTNLQLSVMFFFVFVSLAVISEYIGRLLTETRREPSYFVMEELVSDRLIADSERRNIV